jgi:hypothetical protein
MSRKGIDVPPINGSNNLLRKGAVVNLLHDYLFSTHPVLPKGTTIVLDWMPASAFCGNAGPRIWYGDTTLQVYEIQNTVDSLGFAAKQDPGRPFDPLRTILITFHGGPVSEQIPAAAR